MKKAYFLYSLEDDGLFSASQDYEFSEYITEYSLLYSTLEISNSKPDNAEELSKIKPSMFLIKPELIKNNFYEPIYLESVNEETKKVYILYAVYKSDRYGYWPKSIYAFPNEELAKKIKDKINYYIYNNIFVRAIRFKFSQARWPLRTHLYIEYINKNKKNLFRIDHELLSRLTDFEVDEAEFLGSCKKLKEFRVEDLIKSDKNYYIISFDVDKNKMRIYDKNLNRISNDFDFVYVLDPIRKKRPYYLGIDFSNKYQIKKIGLYKLDKKYKDIDIFDQVREKFLKNQTPENYTNYYRNLAILIDYISKNFNLSIKEINNIFDRFLFEKKILSLKKRKSIRKKLY